MVPMCSKTCKQARLGARRKVVVLPCTGCGKPAAMSGAAGLQLARRGRAYCSEGCKLEVVRRISSETAARTNRKYASERMRNRNPMAKSEVRRTQTAAMKAIAWRPKVRGGNGRTTEPQRMLAEALGWPTEVVVKTGARAAGREDLPNAYKIDIALEEMRIAVEVDGASHRTLLGKEQDARKTAFLEAHGWTVLRFWNSQVLKDLAGCVQTVMSTTSRSRATTTTS